MKGLAELVVSLCDLCEAEGRLLEAGILRTVRRAALLSLGLLFGGAAIALLLGALYALLTSLLSTPAALALLGCASAAIAGVFLWRAHAGADASAREGPEGPEGPERGDADGAKRGDSPAAAGHAPARGHPHGVWEDAAPYGGRGHGGTRS